MTLGLPGWRDPRWGSVTILTTFTILGQTSLHFAVRPSEILTSLCVAVGLDTVLTHRRTGVWAFPLSAVVSGLSIGLLLRSADVAVFVLAALAAIGSKHLLRRSDGRHIFNPSNAGIVVALLFTQGLSEVTPEEWGSSALIALVVCCIGLFVVFRVRRLLMVATFAVSHVVLALATGEAATMSALLPASTLVFCFFMITDPKTAPRTPLAQVAYALLVAGLDQALMSAGSMAAPFLALVIVCACVPLLERITQPGHRVAVLAA